MYRQSPAFSYAHSGYLHARLPVAGLLIITRDNAITYKAQRGKNTELKRSDSSTDMQMRQRDVAALDAKNTRRVS